MYIRPATPTDATAIAAIYRPFVTDTVISFDTDPPDAAAFAARMASAALPWLVIEDAGVIAGYAYASRWRDRAAYAWVAETSIYMAPAQQGRGLGRTLYAALLEAMAARGYVAAIGCIALPNPASVALHEALGFVAIGRHPQVGYKHGGWHDVGFWQKELAPRPAAPQPL
jgi:L-amino acid N-acyltransferase YncA